MQNNRGPSPTGRRTARRARSEEMSINARVFSKAAVIAVLDLGKRIAESDDGGLLDGIAMKIFREQRKSKRQ